MCFGLTSPALSRVGLFLLMEVFCIMPKIQIVTGGATEKHGQTLAQAIEQRMGVEVGVSSPPPRPNPRDMERFGSILDALAVLRETESTLKTQALRLIADNPALVKGSKTLTLDDRVANTVKNRAEIRAVLGDSRPMYSPEEFILAGAAAAVGTEPQPQHLGAAIYLSAQHRQTTEGQFRERLNRPEQSTIELGDQIQRRVEEQLESAESDWDTWRQAAESDTEHEYEAGD